MFTYLPAICLHCSPNGVLVIGGAGFGNRRVWFGASGHYSEYSGVLLSEWRLELNFRMEIAPNSICSHLKLYSLLCSDQIYR